MPTKKELEKEVTKLQKAIISQEKLAHKIQRETFYDLIDWLEGEHNVELPDYSYELLFSLFTSRGR